MLFKASKPANLIAMLTQGQNFRAWCLLLGCLPADAGVMLQGSRDLCRSNMMQTLMLAAWSEPFAGLYPWTKHLGAHNHETMDVNPELSQGFSGSCAGLHAIRCRCAELMSDYMGVVKQSKAQGRP